MHAVDRGGKMQLGLVCLCLLVMMGYCLPLDPRNVKPSRTEKEERLRGRMPDLPGGTRGRKLPDLPGGRKFPDLPGGRKLPDMPGLDKEEYKRYWDEVVKSNPNLQERMKRFKPEDMADLHPRLGERMARNSDDIRNRLEEAKRMNIDEMRQLQKLQMLRDNKMAPDADWLSRRDSMRDKVPSRFSSDELHKRLEEQRKVLEELDQKRREEFKRYEMEMEHKRRSKLNEMDEKSRLRAEDDLRQARERLMKHERLNHPASKKQFEDVWENEDGLQRDQFDPKTFFNLHDTNNDRFLDPLELEALFFREVKKAYGEKGDTMEAHEDMARMREHVMTEMDKDKDGLISLEEFLGYTRERNRFEDNEEWKPVIDEPDQLFDDEELKQFEEEYDDNYYDYDYGDESERSEERDAQPQQEHKPEPVQQKEPQEPEREQQKEPQEPEQEEQREPHEPEPEQQNLEQPAGGEQGKDESPETVTGEDLKVEVVKEQAEGDAQQFLKNPREVGDDGQQAAEKAEEGQ